MRNYTQIEKRGLYRGVPQNYWGYSPNGQAWIITKKGKSNWRAYTQSGIYRVLNTRTLQELNEKLLKVTSHD
jgi:hypothetical protein